MKLSFMTFACPLWSVVDIIDGALTYGYDGVELRVESDHRHGIEISTPPETRQRLRARFEDAGVELPCLATSLRFARAGELGRRERERALPLLDLAADMGTPGLRVFGGEPQQEDIASDSIARQDAIAWAADNLRQLVDEAAARGVQFWFETHDYFRLGRDAAAVIRAVAHPAVRCNWDVMHPWLNGEDLAQTEKYLDGLVAHVHFHDARAADAAGICPFGEGALPLREMLQWLRDQNFNGFLSAEYFGDALGESPDDSLPLWADGCRRLLRENTG